ncbi:hypothetical protein [Haloglomus salinum]|uniref:hypothetical protein n=1 Tax=Haloglomus salinum TaxID=2962673 RepID=UPI0020C9B519|nr:hypothetical protein [Haloglomus salinum]
MTPDPDCPAGILSREELILKNLHQTVQFGRGEVFALGHERRFVILSRASYVAEAETINPV